ncbi:hypothetical protein LJC23_01250 [Desulfovibrio sp. OttesenSCG-928-I05]|nr:hypothetical protein [Desulfovibrio sp. OttesenSCG-928-I05]
MKHQGSKVTLSRFPRILRALHGLVFLYALAMFFLGAAPVFDEAPLLTHKEFWFSFGLALPFLAASGVAFVSLATDTLHGTALCLCFFVLLSSITLAHGGSPASLLFFIALILFYGISVITFFRSIRDKWAEHVAMRSFAHKTSFFKNK